MISTVLELWHLPVAGGWLRPDPQDHVWAAASCRRGDRCAHSSPERVIEHEILGPGSEIAPGACLLVEHSNGPRRYLAEVSMANTPGRIRRRNASGAGHSGTPAA